jgi:hypothetical protein
MGFHGGVYPLEKQTAIGFFNFAIIHELKQTGQTHRACPVIPLIVGSHAMVATVGEE